MTRETPEEDATPETVLNDPGPDGLTPDDVQPGSVAGDAIAGEAPSAMEEVEEEIEEAAVRGGPSTAMTWGFIAIAVLAAVLLIASL
jgi:hypothetical protein